MQLVSVICTCFNHENHVITALESVWHQSYTPIEIIIIDDASTDNSVMLIENWIADKPSIKFLKNKTNLGITKSFNSAAAIANGAFLMDFATDDILFPEAIAKLVTKFENSSHKNLGLVYANLENITEDGKFIRNYFENEETQRPTGYIFSSILDSGKSICSPTALISRTVFTKLNGYDENLAYEDLDFWIRLARQYEIDYLDTVLVQKRILDSSLGNQFYVKENASKMNHSTFLILQKASKICSNNLEFKMLLKRIHHEILLNFKHKNFGLLFQLFLLKIKIEIALRLQ